ncbi:MAG: LamG domain-containing protein, partial [Bacteroidales bacterium]|nr:LamG domain-containing protein [Bacteroidales bacterium]
MKTKVTFFIIIIMLNWINYSKAQSIDTFASIMPNPIRNYPLDSMSAVDKASGKNGIIRGVVNNFTDRYGNPLGAMQFPSQTYIETPNFFDGVDYTKGFTISFWTYIDENITKKQGGIEPWDNNDTTYHAFYARNASNILLGFERRRDRAIINRYVTDINQQIKDFKVWFWDPVNFTNRQGWYHIILVFNKAKVTAYLNYPNGQNESMSYYFRIQDLSKVALWGLGNNLLGKNSSIKVLDDFKVFAQVFTDAQVQQLQVLEGVTGGMFQVTRIDDPDSYWAVYENKMETESALTLMEYNPALLTAPFQWIFIPVEGKPSVFQIKAAYGSRAAYLTFWNYHISNYVISMEYRSQDSKFYEWYVTQTPDGFHYIQPNWDRNLYLYYVHDPVSDRIYIRGATKGLVPESRMMWDFGLFRTTYELNNYPLDKKYVMVVPTVNTFLNIQPSNPNNPKANTHLLTTRELDSKRSIWRFEKALDGSYYITSSLNRDLNWMPSDAIFTDDNYVNIGEKTLSDYYYYWVPDNTSINRFGRTYNIMPAVKQTGSIGPLYEWYGAPALMLGPDRNSDNKKMQIFQSVPESNLPAENKQLYSIQPGTYRIKADMDTSLYMCTANYSYDDGSVIKMQSFNNDRRTSYYWSIDYERDINGTPIRDGSYMVSFFGTDTN